MALLAGTPAARVPRRRHEPGRPDEARRRHARTCWSTSRASRSTESTRLPDGGLRIGAGVRNSDLAADHARPRALPGALRRRCSPGASGQLRNLATTAGNLLQRTRCALLPGRHQAVQQARAGLRLPGASRATTATSRSSGTRPALHRHPPVGHGRRAGRARRRRRVIGPAATRDDPAGRPAPAARRRPERDTVLEHGELITAVELPPLRSPRSALPQGARPRLLRVRARLASRPPSTWPTAWSRDVARVRRRRAHAVAGDAGRGRRCAGAGDRGDVRRGRRRELAQARAAAATTRSRCRWRATSIVRTLLGAGGVSAADHARPRSAPARPHRRAREGHAARPATPSSTTRRARRVRRPSCRATIARGADPLASTPRRPRRCRGVLAVLYARERAAAAGDRRRAAVLQSPGRRLPRPDRRGGRRRRRSEAAQARRGCVRVEYDAQPHDVVLRADHPALYAPEKVNPSFATDTERRRRRAALAGAAVDVDATYTTPAQHNNPMEPHATIARLGRRPLTLFDSTQGARAVRRRRSPRLLGLEPEQVRVVSPHVGGGVRLQGPAAAPTSSSPRWPPGAAAGRSSWRSPGSSCSRSPATARRPSSGSGSAPTRDGRLIAIAHDAVEQTSTGAASSPSRRRSPPG